MFTRLFAVGLLVAALLVFAAFAVFAQAPTPATLAPLPQPITADHLSNLSSLNLTPGQPPASHTQATTRQNAIGAPGLSFRYVQRFGETTVGYPEDSTHFYSVMGIGSDGANIWIADSWGDRVLKFDSNGNFLQQIGKASFRDATDTPLDFISDVAVDPAGNIWVVDGEGTHIVKFSASGEKISELGKTWERGPANDRFNDPHSLAFDSAGNLYVSDSGLWNDYGNHRIQIFNSAGEYLTTIGETGVDGSDNNHLFSPRRIAIYGAALYIADAANHRVQIFDITNPAAPTYLATLGVTAEAGTDNSHFDYPEGVGVDATSIYVADSNNNRVQIFSRTTRTYVATLDGGNDAFYHPTDVLTDQAGHLYVADAWNKRVQQYDSQRHYVRTYGTKGISYQTDGVHYNYPTGVAVATDGSLYVVENRGQRLLKLNAAGAPQWIVGEAGQSGNDNAHFFFPEDVAVDSANRVYVADDVNHRVQIFSSAGAYLATLGGNGPGTGNNQLNEPFGVAIDSQGRIYVADANNQRVQVFDSNRNFLRTLGQTEVAGSDNAHFSAPRDVAVDLAGNLYVADEGNHRVQVFSGNLTYVRTIGVSGECGNDFDHLCAPNGVTVDTHGYTFVVDNYGSRIQVFSNTGAYLTTIGGSVGSNSGQLREADGVAVDSAGNLYVAEYSNHRIQKYTPGVPGWQQTNINGFGHPQVRAITGLTAVGGALFASMSTWDGSGARRLLRSEDGTTWNEVIGHNFGALYHYETSKLVEFAGNLYLGTSNWNWNQQQSEGAGVWRSPDGLAWSAVITGGFDDPNNSSVVNLIPFDNHLYVATAYVTQTRGVELWRSSTGNTDDWSKVVTNGFGDQKNWSIYAMDVFSNALYAGTYNEVTGGELWRTSDGANWTQLFVDGFGNSHNSAIGSLAVFQGKLYAGLRNLHSGGEIWRSSDGIQWTRVVNGGLGNAKRSRPYSLVVFADYLYTAFGNEESGLEVWRTGDGEHWQRISEAGWGDSNNGFTVADQGVAIFRNHLYMGSWNEANGGELWLYTGASSGQATSQAGGNLINEADGFTLTLPAGAVSTTVTLAFNKLDSPNQTLPTEQVGVRYFTLSAQDENGNEVTQFKQAYTLVLTYLDEELLQARADEATLTCLYWDQVRNQWMTLTTERDPVANKVTCRADHFTEFALVSGASPLQFIFLPMITRQ